MTLSKPLIERDGGYTRLQLPRSPLPHLKAVEEREQLQLRGRVATATKAAQAVDGASLEVIDLAQVRFASVGGGWVAGEVLVLVRVEGEVDDRVDVRLCREKIVHEPCVLAAVGSPRGADPLYTNAIVGGVVGGRGGHKGAGEEG